MSFGPQSMAALFPPQASEYARQVDHIFLGLMAVSGFIVLLLMAIIGYGLFKQVSHRHGAGRFLVKGSKWVETGWMVIPLLIFLGLFAWGAHSYLGLSRAPAEGPTIYIIGRQWMWQSYYADGHTEQNALHLPAGQRVRLVLASEDVIHSLYIPAFRLKHDVVPGKSVQVGLTPTEPGRYRLYCAEYCGLDHAIMGGWVEVLDETEYAEWQARHSQDLTFVQRGEKLFREHGCSGCHATQSTVHAPPLEGLYGSQVPLQSGRFVTANLAYLRDSILLPGQDIAAGYENAMPSFDGVLSEADLAAILAYLQAIGKESPHE